MNNRFGILSEGHQRVKTALDTTSVRNAAPLNAVGNFATPGPVEIQWPDGIARGGGWIPLLGYTRVVIFVKPSVAAEYRLSVREHDLDEDPVVVSTLAVAAGTKVLLYDVDLSQHHSFLLESRSTAAAGDQIIFMKLM